ncbi:hypothetical protein V7094_29035 [Priestia megaterium]|uniref:hypothetical protein n=1 Tax=Priestia megaterium TaxID=1404 RepID=UPI002FFD89E8
MKFNITARKEHKLSAGDLIVTKTPVGIVNFLVIKTIYCNEVSYKLLNMSTQIVVTNVDEVCEEDVIPALRQSIAGEVIEVIPAKELLLSRVED